ncbi:hypothetical protein GCM10011600_01210 [Pseudolysinimonas yzui]|uniref:Septum formation-related domain-containing protein n=1 Tax=Pseudolysinimonas yzui TaxID=2708254 RepID=A0A8J3GML4_9MICO|nr:hypothetical protein GCM10011600_01210 [Pseudolysinimonas yzui]
MAFAVVVIALAALIAFRVATRAPAIPLGETAIADLQPGSCVAEDRLDLATYTVVACSAPHPQQVFASADLELDESVYAQTGGALDAFGDAVCDRYLEYRLFLDQEIERTDYTARAIGLPTPDEYAAGDTDALCVIARGDGDDLTDDLYRPMP